MRNYFFLFISFCISCDSNDKINFLGASEKNVLMHQLQLLLGDWQNISDKGSFYETWTSINDLSLKGTSFFIQGKDTLFSESIVLEIRGKDLYYVPTVKNQNDGNPVYFKLTSFTNNEFIFENAAHDFPQKISYTVISNDSLLTEVSGLIDGQIKIETCSFNRKR